MSWYVRSKNQTLFFLLISGLLFADFNTIKHEMITEDGDPVTFSRIGHVTVQMPNSLESQSVECSLVINAAGAWSSKVAELAGIGTGPSHSLEGIKLPVEPKKRCLFKKRRTRRQLYSRKIPI
ncbi:FAD-dependent oxidoreductase domain-containing protein 1-like [Xenopus laevis]|uniref:FAD-dependent oxidoreductase domain-containing protein 1-like n=1 Tax=Xenopus laevis TaxID=8355 RepID=A0A8J1LCJ2_XENLA|nr:FAD-dependent oxidoreductase domain-containing protein 1-like [Xenopus laevis]